LNVSHIKWVLVGAVLVVFIPWFAVVMSRESSSQDAIENFKDFAQPHMTIKFSKTIPWDPQSFLGRGRTIGFWDWSEKGVVLTSKGQNIFAEPGGKDISGDVVVGKRKITTVKSVQPVGANREVLFLYAWTELTDVAKLFSKPPEIGKEYQGLATLVEKTGAWDVKALTTPDFSRAVEILMAETSR